MTKLSTRTSAVDTIAAAAVSRRSLMKSALALGAVGFASPLYVKNAFSSSGELNFIGWAGYTAFAEKVFPAFTAGTGIKVNSSRRKKKQWRSWLSSIVGSNHPTCAPSLSPPRWVRRRHRRGGRPRAGS